MSSELGRRRGLAGALETHQHELRRGLAGSRELMLAGAEDFGQLFVDDFDDLLARGYGLQHLPAHGALFHPRHKLAGHLEIHVGAQQGQSHLPKSVVYVLFRKPAAAGEAVEDARELVRQCFKHIAFNFSTPPMLEYPHSMIPLKLSLQNFLCYRDDSHTLDLRGIRVACLCGNNGHGKSALLDSITWALWGKARGSGHADLVHFGRSEMWVELEFQAG